MEKKINRCWNFIFPSASDLSSLSMYIPRFIHVHIHVASFQPLHWLFSSLSYQLPCYGIFLASAIPFYSQPTAVDFIGNEHSWVEHCMDGTSRHRILLAGKVQTRPYDIDIGSFFGFNKVEEYPKI